MLWANKSQILGIRRIIAVKERQRPSCTYDHIIQIDLQLEQKRHNQSKTKRVKIAKHCVLSTRKPNDDVIKLRKLTQVKRGLLDLTSQSC